MLDHILLNEPYLKFINLPGWILGLEYGSVRIQYVWPLSFNERARIFRY